MTRQGQPSQARIAEKLTILNDRGIGLLNRLYDLKKSLKNEDTKPKIMSDKSLESVIKSMDSVKRFNPTACSAQNHGNSLNPSMRAEILKTMQHHYFTLVDVMEFKDNVGELLVIIDANQIYFDISLNFDLTKRYLDLVSTYVALMILLSRIDERRVLIGLYNVAHDSQHSSPESQFHRLGQLLIDFDFPIKRICEDSIPHVKCLAKALLSIKPIYDRRDLTATQWQNSQYLSIISEPTRLIQPARSDTLPCEYLSIDCMQRWIVLGFLIIHQQLGEPTAAELWRRALSTGWVITLWRDEVLHAHTYIEKTFERLKGYEKRQKEVKDVHHKALLEATTLHKERRKFLRISLKEMNLLLSDQPGLLGPKALMPFMLLSIARDEVHWLLRHANNLPSGKGKVKVSAEDLNDRQLPELLFYIEELRGLIKKYSQVLQRYYIQYLKGHDADELKQLVSTIPALSADENTVVTNIISTIDELDIQSIDEESHDLTGLRVDWVRLQAYISSNKSQMSLRDPAGPAKKLSLLVNTISFHTKMVDYLDEILNETSDLSLYCFYTTLLEQQFRQCMEFPAQHRYSIVFPLVCSHFLTTVHTELCPEEKLDIGQTSVQYCNWFLREMSEEINQVITAICEEQTQLSDLCLPKRCINKLMSEGRRGTGRGKKNQRSTPFVPPGTESERKFREDFSRLDKLHMALTELSFALNYTPIIHVWGHGFVPREFFIHNLEGRFNKALPGMLMHNPETEEIAKPSEVLSGLRALMDVLQSLESYINVDISRIFNTVLLQQTQRLDGLIGEKTITNMYTEWYLETLLRHVSTGHIVYSPLQKAFVSLSTEEKLSFSAEEFSDVRELRSLVELLGPYGMRYLGEQLMSRVALQVHELKLLVVGNREVLTQLRTSFDKPGMMVDLARRLQGTDNLLQRLTIIGVLLSFRKMLQDVLYDNMLDHAPFLMSSIKDFSDNVPSGHNSTAYVNEMAASAGFKCTVDPLLVAAIRNMKAIPNEDEYKVACLLMVFIAVVLPRKASNITSVYNANLDGHTNNLHCIARAINQLAQAIFLVQRENDVEERLKEFLALASSSLLRLGQETDKESIRCRESIYLLLHIIVNESSVLSMDLLESCFPYSLLRHAYSAVINNSVSSSNKH